MNAQDKTPPVKETEVTAKATRRRFTAEYKAKILKEASLCTRHGEVGALLRREGLYSSNLTAWRMAQLQRGEHAGLVSRKRGPKAPDERDRQLARLERELATVRGELTRSNAVIEIQKKVSELLGLPPLTTSGKS